MYALLRRLDVSVEIYSINEVVMSDHYIAFPSKGVVYILRSIIVRNMYCNKYTSAWFFA
jgi:hypothetical protein